MWKQIGPAFRITLVFTVLTGLIYPGVITALCRVLFPRQADGSLVTIDGQVVGSSLMGQNFSKPEYFQPRPSAAGREGYDASASNGSNYGPTSAKLMDRVKVSIDKFRKDNPDYSGPIPSDLVTASGSGLDPEISLASAEAQAARVAKARGVSVQEVERLAAEHAEGRTLDLWGEPRVNVLLLNLALNQVVPKK